MITNLGKYPAQFSGAKFALRYQLGRFDFFALDGNLFLRDGIAIPDDPPIFDLDDAPDLVAKQATRAEFDNASELLAAIEHLHGRIAALEALNGITPTTYEETKAAIVAVIEESTAGLKAVKKP